MSNSKYDIIIIGTGLGGLVCGYALAKSGRKVLLLEKNAQIGGCLQNFKRFGVKFDTGMHYIGSMAEGEILHQLFTFLTGYSKGKSVNTNGYTEMSSNASLPKISRLDDSGFDVFSIGGKEYKYAAGYEHFVDTLSQQFPDCRNDIREYVKQLRQIAENSPLYDMRKLEDNSYHDSPYLQLSVNDFLSSITHNKLLQNVLAGNLPLYAGVADKTPAYIYALISNSYLQSAWRIIGGSDNLAQYLATSIAHYGGEIRTHSEVTKIHCDNNKATTVTLNNSEKIEADYFISDIHPQALIPLIDSKLIRPIYRKRIQELENTAGNFTLYLKFKENRIPYMNHNFYYYADEDVWKTYYAVNQKPQSYLYMHQCIEEGQKYAQSAEIMGMMSYQEVAQWADSKSGHRSADYYEFKRQKAEQYLELLEQSFPSIRQNIEAYETSTPLTYRDYTGTTEGSTYGILHDKNNFEQTRISQRTKIPNLFLTGQNIHWHGILGVTVGAMLTCRELGVKLIVDS